MGFILMDAKKNVLIIKNRHPEVPLSEPAFSSAGE
jgi:hypothetical protein